MKNLNLILYILIHIVSILCALVAIKMNLFVEYLAGMVLIIVLIIFIKAKTKNN